MKTLNCEERRVIAMTKSPRRRRRWRFKEEDSDSEEMGTWTRRRGLGGDEDG